MANNAQTETQPTETKPKKDQPNKFELDKVEKVTAIVAALVLVAAVGIRSVSEKRVEITLNDAIIAAIAAVIVLLLAGRISKLGLSAQGVTLETAAHAILSAAHAPIERQVNLLPLGLVQAAPKLETTEISKYVDKGVQALEFFLSGSVYYVGDDVKKYLEELTKHAFFRYVIILAGSKFFGMIDARQLLSILQQGTHSFNGFAEAVRIGNDVHQHMLQQIPGFVPASAAVTLQTDKREVLARMEKRDLDWWPVTTPDGTFEGVVERSRLTASLILDVTNQLKVIAAKPNSSAN